MVAVPAPAAVITPSATVATLSSEEAHATRASAGEYLGVTVLLPL